MEEKAASAYSSALDVNMIVRFKKQIQTDLRCTLRVTVVLLPVGTARLVAMQL